MVAPRCKKAFSLDLKQTQKTVLQLCSSKMSSSEAELLGSSYWTSTILIRSHRLMELVSRTMQHGENVLFLILKKEGQERRIKSSPKKKGFRIHSPIFPLFT